MRVTIQRFLVLLLLVQIAPAFAQDSGTPNPGFTLTLSQGLPRGEFPKGTQTLIVRLTNTSDNWIREDACEAGGALYKLMIAYNGVQQNEPDWIRKRREAAETGEAKGGLCFGSNPGRRIALGQYWEDALYYETLKPGTYQFTVEIKLPQPLSDSTVAAKSNTLTIVVPPANPQTTPK